MTNLVEKMVDKSKEAFLMAIEVYNKPSIRYRVEGFSFFLCNAWELMLKAHMINKFGETSIYYKDSNNRTLSLERCIAAVFTNDKDPLRRNLEKIVELRNTSTHFITEEYEMVYIPLFQAAVFNFIEKMQAFHNVDMSESLPAHFLTLSVSFSAVNGDEIRAKYPTAIADKLMGLYDGLSRMIDENNDRFAIRVDHRYYITKNEHSATAVVRIDSNAEHAVKIVKEWKDPNNTHKYTAKKCCAEINRRLRKSGDAATFGKFNLYHFDLFCKHYGLKQNPAMCYVTRTFSQPKYGYSIHAIELIAGEIHKDPANITENLKKKIKSTPGAKEFST